MEELIKQLKDEEISIADIDQETLNKFNLTIFFIDEGDWEISGIEDSDGKVIHTEDYPKEEE